MVEVYIDCEGNESIGNLYRKYEEYIKSKESNAFSIVGADGAIYALRRELFTTLPSVLINDFLHPIQVVINGYKAISEPDAICFEVCTDSIEIEYSRQTRIMSQSWRLVLATIIPLIVSKRFGFVWQLLSHKFLRWLSLPLMSVLLLSNLLIYANSFFYIFTMVIQLCFYLYAILGYKFKSFNRTLLIFILLQVAAIAGLIKHIKGINYVTWEPKT